MNFFIQHLDLIKVGLISGAYFGLSLTDANELLKFASGIATLGYLVYKWRKDIKGK